MSVYKVHKSSIIQLLALVVTSGRDGMNRVMQLETLISPVLISLNPYLPHGGTNAYCDLQQHGRQEN